MPSMPVLYYKFSKLSYLQEEIENMLRFIYSFIVKMTCQIYYHTVAMVTRVNTASLKNNAHVDYNEQNKSILLIIRLLQILYRSHYT